MDGRLENFLITLCIGALIVYMHKPNIKRLIAGNENKFGQKRSIRQKTIRRRSKLTFPRRDGYG